MKKILFLLPVLLIILCGKALSQNCCAKPGKMQALALNMEFKAAHEPSIPFTYTPENCSCSSVAA